MRRTRHQPGEYNNITLLQKLIFEFQAQTGVGQWLVILKSEYLDFDLRSTNPIKNLTFCNHPNLDPELRPSSCGWVLTHIHMFLCIFVLLRIYALFHALWHLYAWKHAHLYACPSKVRGFWSIHASVFLCALCSVQLPSATKPGGDETKVLHFELPLAYCVYCINCKYFILHILHSKLPPISTASSSSAPHSYFSTKRNTFFGILEWHFCYTNCVAKVHSIWQRIPWHIPFCPKHIIRSPPFKNFISRM